MNALASNLRSPMFGSHLSIAGGMVNALEEAARLELDCVQVFTKNQRQWKQHSPSETDRADWLAKLRDLGWTAAKRPGATVSHNSYLINLASPDDALRRRSTDLQRCEMENCALLDIPFLVAHPGAHLGSARSPKEPNRLDGKPTPDELAGLKRIARSLNELHHDLPGLPVITCLETTVGSGTNLGYDFHHLRIIRDLVAEPERVGFCFDTCHVTAAGYDMTTPETATAVLEQFDRVCGLDHLYVIHLNDSVGAVGSRKDRHAHIGHGCCGESCFRTIVNHPRFRAVPKILETPKEIGPGGVPWDVINVRALKQLMEPAAPADKGGVRPRRSKVRATRGMREDRR